MLLWRNCSGIALLTGVILTGLFENLCLMFVYVCFMFVKWLVLWTDLTEGWCICEKSLEMCICLWPEFDCPEVTLCHVCVCVRVAMHVFVGGDTHVLHIHQTWSGCYNSECCAWIVYKTNAHTLILIILFLSFFCSEQATEGRVFRATGQIWNS